MSRWSDGPRGERDPHLAGDHLQLVAPHEAGEGLPGPRHGRLVRGQRRLLALEQADAAADPVPAVERVVRPEAGGRLRSGTRPASTRRAASPAGPAKPYLRTTMNMDGPPLP
jgi:hypothetical protein